jgi:hypothetical protein
VKQVEGAPGNSPDQLPIAKKGKWRCAHCDVINFESSIGCPLCGNVRGTDPKEFSAASVPENRQPIGTAQLVIATGDGVHTSDSVPRYRCPYCVEEIAAAALKCCHCGEWLDAKAKVQARFPRGSPTGSASL